MFYFAWVDAPVGTESEIAFLPEYAREDEQVFSFALRHVEGEFPELTLSIKNPKVGLLTPARKRWAWFAMDSGTEVVPLFFGRLVGVPQSIQNELVALTFVAKPVDFEEQRGALAESLKVAPYWDSQFISPEDWDDPDRALDARAQLWHVDRVTHEVTASDIVTPEDGHVALGESQVIYESLDVTFSTAPARSAIVTASFIWDQITSGTLDVTQSLLRKYHTVSLNSVQNSCGDVRTLQGNTLNLIGAAGMAKAWPKEGANIGGGWTVGVSSLRYLSPERYADIQVADRDPYEHALEEVRNYISTTYAGNGYYGTGHINFNSIYYATPTCTAWVPIVPTAPHLELNFSVTRQYTETLTFELVADVAELYTDEASSEPLRLDMAEIKVDAADDTGELPISDVRRRTYLQTDRGLDSVEYLIALARANLLMRSRAIDVKFNVALDEGLELTCRKGVNLTDNRLPGGTATGKIKQYSLSFDGSSGRGIAEIVMGCTAGRGGSVSGSTGTPTYVEVGYTGNYQVYENVVNALGTEVTYNASDVVGAAISDDGKDLLNVNEFDFVVDISVTGGLIAQDDAVTSDATGTVGSSYSLGEMNFVLKKLDRVETISSIEVVPVTGGPFTTSYVLTLSELKIPTGVDLEAVA